MNQPFNPHNLQFYLTIPTPCPYLDGRMERKIFTQLDPFSGSQLNNYLTHAGFRRSQSVIYRPACETCRACQSLRVNIDAFAFTRRFRRIIKLNQDLSAEIQEPFATREQYELLKSYLLFRHPHGGMAEMDFMRYEMMIEDGCSDTSIVEYRTPSGSLIACSLVDGLTDGSSMVYSFFDPKATRRGLGNYMVLDQILSCKRQSLPYLYLGYWVENSPKMAYKKLFKPAEILTGRGWRNLEQDD